MRGTHNEPAEHRTIALSALGTCSGLTNWQGRLLIGEYRVRLAFS